MAEGQLGNELFAQITDGAASLESKCSAAFCPVSALSS